MIRFQVETTCHQGAAATESRLSSWTNNIMSDEPYKAETVRNRFVCHGMWTQVTRVGRDHSDVINPSPAADYYLGGTSSRSGASSLLLRSPPRPQQRHLLVLSASGSLDEDHNSLDKRKFLCLSYTEKDGVLMASASDASCDLGVETNEFNITSSGPCTQALTGTAHPTHAINHFGIVVVSIVVVGLTRALL